MKYTYQFDIPYQEVDMNRRLRLYRLENYLLNVAGLASDEAGIGIQALLPYNLTWVITRLHLEITYIPTHCDKISVTTWVEQNSHMLSTRNYLIYLISDSTGKKMDTPILIGRAKSIWAVLDIEKREIANVFHLSMFKHSVDGEELALFRSRILPIQQPTGIKEYTIQYSDIDYNGHCNSCKYLEMMLNAYRPAFLNKFDFSSSPLVMDINYVKEVYIADCVHILFKESSDEVIYSLKDSNDKISCTCLIHVG